MQPQLPNELVDMIFDLVWRTFIPTISYDPSRYSSPKQHALEARLRWSSFGRLCQASRQFKAIVEDLARRTIIIEYEEDFTMHHKLASAALNREGAPLLTELFITIPFLQQTELPPAVLLRERIFDFMATCRSLSVLLNRSHVSKPGLCEIQLAFDCLSRAQGACRDVHLVWLHPHRARFWLPTTLVPAPAILSPAAFQGAVTPQYPGVRSLRLANYPRCTCPCVGGQRGGAGGAGHVPRCLSHLLPTLFSELERVHFETPCSLKHVVLPPAVARLEIDAPPQCGRASGSLVLWSLASAVNGGLMRMQVEEEDWAWRKKLIVVNTGPLEPDGWAVAMAACEKARIGLERRAVYKIGSGTTIEAVQ
ncbi:uncharacterized protein BXZ73DRAFT_79054 [Epithele typhae]|uniref:uncharacterized protein n=1 Tax=Epithele typhae TaxID=378194 RepID=UPI00200856F5|nr:uncharacterized protein BXZ73DRAFT_79054 [Epithele typhae]KAH9925392.1 hypothetical protein BXZ73DRAFT_79054 [Epithele typhae]